MNGHQKTPCSTPVKVVSYFSPGAFNICFLCQNVCADASGKTKLWKDDNTLTLAGEMLGDILPALKLSRTSDFQVLCRNCWRQVQTLAKKLTNLLEKVNHGRHSSQEFVRKRFKRGQKDSQQHQSSKKKLIYSKTTTDNLGDENASQVNSIFSFFYFILSDL